MERVKIKHGENPREFGWTEIIDAAYHNLGDRAGKVVVHIAVDQKGASGYGVKQVDMKTGLLVDAALYTDILSEYPEEEIEYLEEFVFLRAFLFNEEDPEKILEWCYELFYPETPSYLWINGKLCGGLVYPQSDDPDDYPPLKEELSDFVIYRPETA